MVDCRNPANPNDCIRGCSYCGAHYPSVNEFRLRLAFPALSFVTGRYVGVGPKPDWGSPLLSKPIVLSPDDWSGLTYDQ